MDSLQFFKFAKYEITSNAVSTKILSDINNVFKSLELINPNMVFYFIKTESGKNILNFLVHCTKIQEIFFNSKIFCKDLIDVKKIFIQNLLLKIKNSNILKYSEQSKNMFNQKIRTIIKARNQNKNISLSELIFLIREFKSILEKCIMEINTSSFNYEETMKFIFRDLNYLFLVDYCFNIPRDSHNSYMANMIEDKIFEQLTEEI